MTTSQWLDYLAIFFSAGFWIIAAGIAFNFLHWLAVALYRQGLIFIDWASVLLMQGAARLGRFLKFMVCESVLLVFAVIWGTWLRLYQPCACSLRNLSIAVRQYMKLRQLFWKYGRHEFASFAQFRRSVLGEEEPPPKQEQSKQQPAPEKSTYAQALEVLGFAEGQVIDRAMLKTRQRELAAVLHPDKGFPNHVFMQQINDAVDCIKRAKKWK
ncbi:J domain-containing protein [uncultured Pseudomonas sp.]|uniref:J domain-containing protein n=1 Tax=uncultured Pseudomonas sp. TaxID=114707 RepID=UPI002623A984|nr:J domain-containing protein [uncultured Pseudomonas sp.]